MASTYTTNLGIEKIQTGQQAGQWGDTTNTNFDIIDQAVNGVGSVTLTSSHTTSGGAQTLPITDGAVSDGRNAFIDIVDGGDIGGNGFVKLTPSDAEKILHIRNSLSASRSVVVFQGNYDVGRAVTISNGLDQVIKFDGAGDSSAVAQDIYQKLGVASLVTPVVDINGGAIDGTLIGATTPTIGTFTTFTSTGIDDNASTTAITITSGEQVGIGTVNPAHLLDIESSANTVALRVHSTSLSDSSNPEIRVEGITTGIFENIGGPLGGTKISQDGGSSLLFKSNNDIAVTGRFTTFTSTGIDDNATSTAITIDSSERVGFNATSPAVEVHIRDQNYGTLSSSTPVLRIDSNSVLASNSKIELKAGSGTASIFRYSDGSDNYLAIEETGTGGTSGIRINDADLGVGLFTAGSSSSPDFKVDTSGDVTVANNMTVAGAVVKLTGLPTSDPASAGQLWNDSGTLKISAG